MTPERVWVLIFEDQEQPREIFVGDGAESAARARYEQCKQSWNCYLLTNVEELDDAEARAAEAEQLLDLERKQRDVFRDKLSMLLPCAEVGDSEDALVSRATEAVRELQEARHRKAKP